MDPYVAPIYENMYRLYTKDKIDKCIQDGLIEIIPFAAPTLQLLTVPPL